MHFQDLILTLQRYWADRGCLLIQPYDTEKGAATFNPATFLRALGPEPFNVAWAEPCRRPTDGRYGENPIRMQHYYQFQVILKPSPHDILDQYIGSLAAIGITSATHDIRLVHDDWESPTLGAWGLGWEVWVDGMEVTQFTYFQQVGGIDLKPITGEITYGLERLCMFLQGVDNVFQLSYNEHVTYGDVFHQNEVQCSRYNFEVADIELHRLLFDKYEVECRRLCAAELPLPAADYCLKASHAFNLLDARGAISVNERQAYILRVRQLARAAAEAWLANREALGYPLLKEAPMATVAEAPAAAASPSGSAGERLPLLIEIGVEEMPAQVFNSLLKQLPQLFAQHLGSLDLQPSAPTFYVTPRRIAIAVDAIATRQPDQTLEIKGPPLRIARDADGNWSKAASGWARKNNLELDEIEIREIGGADYLYTTQHQPGRAALDLLAEAIPALFDAIHWYKTMRWAHGDGASFVRPVKWLVALLGEEVIAFSYAGITSSDHSFGHRFMAPHAIKVSADRESYLATLREAKVIVDHEERRAEIRRQVEEVAAAHGLAWREDEGLLTEVSHLVEFPYAVLCSFDESILEVPDLVLISEMKEHQKQLALLDAEGRLSNSFIGISNTRCDDFALVRQGYEKVLGSRFSDARFFLREDKKRSLDSRVADLGGVVFQEQLGTILDKVVRVEKLSQWLAAKLNMSPDKQRHVQQIAHLCKADLTTLMVYEFPELQGDVGRYYAIAEGLPEIVSDGIRDHYLPKGLSEALPGSDEAAVVAIADRLDSLVGIFGIGKGPTSSSDPYALRRACIGTIAIIVNRAFRIDLRELLRQAYSLFPAAVMAPEAQLIDELMHFYFERARRLFAEPERAGVPVGFCYDTIAAVMQANAPWHDFTDLVERLRAMQQFRQRDDFADVAATFKRTSNILDAEVERGPVDPQLLTEPAEQALLEHLLKAETAIRARVDAGDYLGALGQIAPLRESVNAFFDGVRVNDEDQKIRTNRHRLVQRVVDNVIVVADFAQIQEG